MSKPGNIRDGLRAALQAERDANARLSEIRREIRDRITAEVAAGKPLANIARATFKFRVGRTPSMRERLREAKRLQKQQERATRGRQEGTREAIAGVSRGVGSSGKENPMTRLVKRVTTTTEEYGVDDDTTEEECTDDKASASAEEKDEEDLDDQEDEEEDEEEDEDEDE